MRGLAVLVAVAAVALAGAAPLRTLDEAGYARMVRSHRGHVVVVDFWATWCDSCREEMPRLVRLARELKVQLVTVSADEPEQEAAASAFLEKVGVSGVRYMKRVASDRKFIDSIDPKWSGALPAVFVYAASGERAASIIGDSTADEIAAAVRKVLPPR